MGGGDKGGGGLRRVTAIACKPPAPLALLQDMCSGGGGRGESGGGRVGTRDGGGAKPADDDGAMDAKLYMTRSVALQQANCRSRWPGGAPWQSAQRAEQREKASGAEVSASSATTVSTVAALAYLAFRFGRGFFVDGVGAAAMPSAIPCV